MLPASLDEAVRAMAESPGAVPVAGGTDLMGAVNAGLLRPMALLGLGRVTELRGWQYQDGAALLGAGLTHSRMARPDFAALIPALAEAAATVGPPQVRNVGTLGGNIVSAHPSGDTLPVLAALEATVTLVGADGAREVAVSHLLTGLDPLRSGELLAFVRVPLLHAPQVFLKSGGRTGPARAVASVSLVLDPARRAVRCAVGAVAPVPLRPLEAEQWVAGCIDWDGERTVDPGVAQAFGEYVASACVPDTGSESPVPTTARLRRTVSVLARRALGRALK
ncbi:FAD binding domain-containing protein [Streptacidiphilus jiangxiensis]|uniref:CO or xanthine dehydrogenase, FAD-binding subunit n=1 Tax=Streptacidiphilus jiangxiensis TaxID=235985 RepID=A0A1H7RMU7_STRJI|nr:FAD binding domain-containing protein [Streptacidiphilus jiangxiensis]SEL61513.1 CO or xanthine dehydrogenase, FAD-binding subunit [Streptacidiphilus jiangxiensis]